MDKGNMTVCTLAAEDCFYIWHQTWQTSGQSLYYVAWQFP